jgi:dipeptidase E
MKKIIVASTSIIHGSEYLEYILPVLSNHFKGVSTILFIPYARPSGISYDAYTVKVSAAFATINIKVKGIHEYENPKEAVKNAKGIFIGGGNTFELLNQIYANDIFNELQDVVENGTPYLGTSAGSNICGVTIMNTNDMPIVYPPSFKALGFIPFNVNAHYLDSIEGSTHMGETRETRIKEYHVYNSTAVLGLREGSWLRVSCSSITLQGIVTARVFKQNEIPFEIESGSLVVKL